ncbi:hypothetical protein CRYUN_Cryun31cG0087300 [Craigia yunnanensis]
MAPCLFASRTSSLRFKFHISPLPTASLLTRHFSVESDIDSVFLFWTSLGCVADTAVKKRVEDIIPIATGHEREELEDIIPIALNFFRCNILQNMI